MAMQIDRADQKLGTSAARDSGGSGTVFG